MQHTHEIDKLNAEQCRIKVRELSKCQDGQRGNTVPVLYGHPNFQLLYATPDGIHCTILYFA